MILYTAKINKKKNIKEGKEVEIETPLVSLELYEIVGGKTYYYGKTLPPNCEEVKEFGDQEEEFLRVFKDRGLFDKSRELSVLISAHLDDYIPQEELLSWDMQANEAKEFQADKDGKTPETLLKEYPLIANLCIARFGGLEKLEILATKILEKSLIYKTISGNLIGQKQRIQDAILDSKTMEELLKALGQVLDLSAIKQAIN